jgi:hypothetical protein
MAGFCIGIVLSAAHRLWPGRSGLVHNTTYEFSDQVPGNGALEDRTEQEMGYHIGAGIELPIIKPTIAFDIRYVFLDYELGDEFKDVDANFNGLHSQSFLGF